MRYLLFILVLLTVGKESRAQNPAFDSVATQLYFDAPLQTPDTSIFGYFRQHSALIGHPSGRRMQEGQLSYFFGFTTHPTVPFQFNGGQLAVDAHAGTEQNKIDVITIDFDFQSGAQSLEAYQKICDLFSPLATTAQYHQVGQTSDAFYTNGDTKRARKIQVLRIKNPDAEQWVVRVALLLPEAHSTAD